MEEELGGPLFNFIQRKAELTTIGNSLLPLANKILDTYDEIPKIRDRRSINGELRIAAPETLTIHRFESILKEFTQNFPDVRIILSNGTCSKNQRELVEGHVDIAFMLWPELKDENFIDYRLKEEEIVFVTTKDKSDQLHDYLAEDSKEYFIINEKNSCYRNLFEKFTVENNITHIKMMELWSVEAIKKAVIGGLGFSLLPLMSVQEELKKGQLKIISHDEPFEKIHSHMLIKTKKWQSQATEEFVDIVLANAKLW